MNNNWNFTKIFESVVGVKLSNENSILPLNENEYIVYHGTNNQFDKFDFNRATQGIVWFTDSIDSIKNNTHGGMGSKYIMKRKIVLNNPAGWNEYEKYGIGQMKQLGYDGVILPSGDETSFIVFYPRSIKKA